MVYRISINSGSNTTTFPGDDSIVVETGGVSQTRQVSIKNWDNVTCRNFDNSIRCAWDDVCGMESVGWSKGMSDLRTTRYKQMICIEPGLVKRYLTLQPLDVFELIQNLK
jgi:hypothetical protein